MLKIDFEFPFSMDGVWVWAREKKLAGDRVYYRLDISRHLVKEGEAGPAATFVPAHQAEELFQALVEGLQRAGKLPQSTSAQAELEATKRHLGDMRKLVFETDRVVNLEVKR